MIIKADTPQEMQREIVKWLEDLAIQHSIAARMAERKGVIHDEITKAGAYNFAAMYVGKMVIEPKLTGVDCSKFPVNEADT